MNAKEAVNAAYNVEVVVCSEEEYGLVRAALQDFAGKSIDAGDHLRAKIALHEVGRLDKKFDLASKEV